MSDIYISQDGDATVDLQAYSAEYDKRIAELEGEAKQWKEIAKARNTDLGDLAYELAEAQKEIHRLNMALKGRRPDGTLIPPTPFKSDAAMEGEE